MVNAPVYLFCQFHHFYDFCNLLIYSLMSIHSTLNDISAAKLGLSSWQYPVPFCDDANNGMPYCNYCDNNCQGNTRVTFLSSNSTIWDHNSLNSRNTMPWKHWCYSAVVKMSFTVRRIIFSYLYTIAFGFNSKQTFWFIIISVICLYLPCQDTMFFALKSCLKLS